MGLSLAAYIDELHERSDLIWPQAPQLEPLKVTPAIKPLPGIKAVLWGIYGTLLEIDGGTLLHAHPQEIRMQIALEKTIKEFNMWYSMTRRQGQPWEGMLIMYTRLREDMELVGSKRKGDYPELDSARLWRKILDKLLQKEFEYDEDKYGDLDEFAAKIAYFFHASLQGVRAASDAVEMMTQLTLNGFRQGLFTNGQVFTMPQFLHALRHQGSFSSPAELFALDLSLISVQLKLRKPSLTLYETLRENFEAHGIKPSEVLYVSHLLRDDLSVAKKYGFRTALYAADRKSCNVTAVDVRDPDLKPDRLLSEIKQIRDILQV